MTTNGTTTPFCLAEHQWAILADHEDRPSVVNDVTDLQECLSFARETLDYHGAESKALWDLDVQDTSDTSSETVMLLVDTGDHWFLLASRHIELRAFQADAGQDPFRCALEVALELASVMLTAYRKGNP